jgi:hypothetical protein
MMMGIGERIVAGLKTIVLIEERIKVLDDTLKVFRSKAEISLANHEQRLVRLETMIEITRPDGGVLRINQGEPPKTTD